ncbi:MAG: CDP-alcohol phosphatidyltransferase family protein [Candidatus Nanogingivalaceae bacterium]|nr:CDP-alcohol phosphatidyltransferase family protein [Candidatus Nanogingivalaceae bacterium]
MVARSREKPPKFDPRTDILTIPNVMSLAGAVLAWRGAKRINTTAGVAQVVAGRLIDTLDGTVARQTRQTSNFGAIVDAGLDKTTTAKLLYEMWRQDIAPKEVLGLIAAFNTVNAIASTKSAIDIADETVRPDISGKLALAFETGSLFAHAISARLEASGKSNQANLARNIGNLSFVAALPLAVKSTSSYIKRACQQSNQANQ